MYEFVNGIALETCGNSQTVILTMNQYANTKSYYATHKWRLVKKNHLHLISGMILNRNQSLLMRMTMYLFYTFTGIDKILEVNKTLTK